MVVDHLGQSVMPPHYCFQGQGHSEGLCNQNTTVHSIGANNLPGTEQVAKTQPKQDKSFAFIFHHF